MVQQSALTMVNSVSIGNILWSDHAPVFCSLTLPAAQQPVWNWRLNESLLSDSLCESEVRRTISQFQEHHIGDRTSSAVQWEALKCVIRGVLIKHGARLKKERAFTLTSAISKVSQLELLHKQALSVPVLRELQEARLKVKKLLESAWGSMLQRCQGKFYEYGNKCGRMLARALRSRIAQSHIPAIKAQANKVVHCTADIARTFQTYYSKLYNLPAPASTSQDGFFPHSSLLAKLPAEASQQLDDPFTQQELGLVIKDLPGGKSPGPDGFTAKFFKTFTDQLTPLLLQVFNTVSPDMPFPPQASLAHVAVIPKPGKDPQSCSSYRPISLLNVDLKMFAKLIANRLNPLLSSLVHPDQVGFVPGREARDNTIKTIDIIHHTQSRGLPLMVLSLDAEKAFDRISWPSLHQTLAHIGLGPILLSKISTLYMSPSARVKVNGSLSDPFPIFNGTRQGCPLSPLLYILIMENLLAAIRADPDIEGVKIGGCEHKCSAFADDLLVYISNPHISLPALLSVIHRFGLWSNFKINSSKSEALSVGLCSGDQALLHSNFPFSWPKEGISYLGIRISANLSRLFPDNFLPLLNRTVRDLETWSKKKELSWFGRISALKMTILPKFLYLFQTIPITIPTSFWKSLRRCFSAFVWPLRRPRLAYDVLKRSKASGGVGLPDGKLYYLAAAYARFLALALDGNRRLWVQLAADICPISLAVLPWIWNASHNSQLIASFSTKQTMLAIHSQRKSLCLIDRRGPCLPITDNPEFPPGASSKAFLGGTKVTPLRLLHVMVSGRLKSYQDILAGKDIPAGAFFQHIQLSHFVDKIKSQMDLRRLPTDFEKLLMAACSPDHALSAMYKMLLSASLPQIPSYCSSWEGELGRSFSEDQWQRCFILTHKAMIATKYQETCYKVLSRWYRVPVLLHKWFPSVSDQCWRCGGGVGTMSHIWWGCPRLKGFWSAVITVAKEVTGIQVPNSPEALLLFMFDMPINRFKKSLLRCLLQAAKSVIPRKWNSAASPSIEEWYAEIDSIQRMEELVSHTQEQALACQRTWFYWGVFKASQLYLSISC